MRIGALILSLGLCSAEATGSFRPLDFDKILPGNTVSDLLVLATQLFHDVQDAYLGDEHLLVRIANKLVDLIGGIYILNYQQGRAKRSFALLEDLRYLADLMHRTNVEFGNLQMDVSLQQVIFIKGLFLQIEQFLAQQL